MSFKVFAQEVIIGGVIRDKEGQHETLPSVNIFTVDSKTGKQNLKAGGVSDLYGRFKLKVPLNSTVRFSFTGYEPVSYKVAKAEPNLQIYMITKSNIVDEVVVVGYQNKSKADVTSSVTVINTEDIVNTPVSNVMELLQGRVAGMNIQVNNGAPGALPQITVRGVSDISTTKTSDGDMILGSSSPLFVVDGIPQEDINGYDPQGLQSGTGVSPLSMVPYEDIDNIQVLKDAAATSLYGSKGAYGVILIQTKKGHSKKPVVTYSVNYKMNTPPRLRDVAVGRAERNARIQQILQNDTSIYHGYNELYSLPSLSDSLNAYYNNNTNWQDVFYRTTQNQTHYLSFSGGDEIFNYNVNGNYYNEKGIIENTDFNRYGITMKMGYSPNKKFDMSVKVGSTFAINSTGSGSPLSQTGVASGVNASSFLPPPSLYTASNATLGVLSVDNENTSAVYDASVNMLYRLPYNIAFSNTFGYKYSTTEKETFMPGILNSNIAKKSDYSGNSYNMYARTSLGYDTRLAIFKLGLTVGAEISSTKSSGNQMTLVGLSSDYIKGPIGYSPRLSSGTASFVNESNTVSFTFAPSFGLGGNLSTGKGDKYVFNPSLRPEANTAYGSNVKWVVNPGFGFKWNYYLEPFFKSFTNIDYGAVRISWGRTTKYSANVYDIWGTYNLNNAMYNGLTVTSIDFGNLPNADLSPITSTMWNLGSDLYLFKRRLTFTTDMYYKQTDNQLSSINLANHNAFTSTLSSDISLVNYGLEVQMGIKPLPLQSKFDLNCMFSFAINKDVIAKLPNEARQIIQNSTVVNKLGSNALSNYLYVYKGVYANDQDVPVDPATGKRLRMGSSTSKDAYFKAGDPIWVDVNGDYVIDEKDKVIVGNSQPRMTGGLSVNMRYKSFSIQTNSSFVMRRDIINKVLADRLQSYYNPLSTSLSSSGAMFPITASDFWSPTNRNAKYPNPYDYTRSSIINPFRVDQTLFMEDGSYFKINGVSVSYAMPKKVLGLLGVSSMNINASANNIYTFSHYSGINPENVNSLGYDTSGGYPNSRSYTLGVSLRF